MLPSETRFNAVLATLRITENARLEGGLINTLTAPAVQ